MRSAGVAVVLIALAGPVCGGSGLPKISFDAEQHHWGSVYHGSVAEHVFKIMNNGKGVLEISGVRTSCGCTVASGWPKTLKPGEEGTLKASLDTKNRHGHVKTVVSVSSNDPERKVVPLKLEASLVPVVKFVPGPRAVFRNVPLGKTVTQEIEIWPLVDDRIVVLDVTCDQEGIGIELEKIRNDAGDPGYRLSVTLKGRSVAGRMHGQLDLKIKSGKAGVLEFGVKISGLIVGNVSLIPAAANFGMIKDPKKVPSKRIALKRKDGKLLKITRLETDRKNINVRLDETATKNEVVIVVTLAGLGEDEDANRVTGMITAHTDMEDEPVIEIPYIYYMPRVPGSGGHSRHRH